ncbi:hypothetical protein BH10PAT2_BH10PAT2_2010 [soil metagenome]
MSVKTRGFAKMSKEKQLEIASKGGKAAHAQGTAHTFSSEEAKAAGRKGGQAPRKVLSTA